MKQFSKNLPISAVTMGRLPEHSQMVIVPVYRQTQAVVQTLVQARALIQALVQAKALIQEVPLRSKSQRMTVLLSTTSLGELLQFLFS